MDEDLDQVFDDEVQGHLDDVVNDTERFTPKQSVDLWERVRDYAANWVQLLRHEAGI